MSAKKLHDFAVVSSKYSQRMRKLSCKIFNDFYVPEISKKEYEHGFSHPSTSHWLKKVFSDYRTFERNTEKPGDFDTRRNPNYYPAHPQVRQLTHHLREYGLFRDEHRDFNEEMRAIAVSKGKVFPLPRKLRENQDQKKKKR